MKNLLLASIFFAIGFLLTSCGAESVSSLVPPPTLSVGAGTGSEGGNITFTVSLSSTAVSAVTFKYRTEVGTGYTAEQADFTAITEADGTISIGETITTIEVITDYDNEEDGNETFGLVLSAVSGAVFAGGEVTLTVKGTITDNDDVVVPLPTLSVGAGTGGEEVGSITFTVSLSEILTEATTFKYRTEIGTGYTAEQADFTAIAEADGIISIGERTTTIEVMVYNDIEDDDDETFGLVLSAVNGAVFAGGETSFTAIGTITDDDLPIPTLSLEAGTGNEGGIVTFTVSLSEILTEATTFKYRTEIGTGDTADQADFTAIAETDRTISIGKTTTTIEVMVDDNTSKEGDKTFSLVLSDVSGAVFAGGEVTLIATGTITDNEVVDANGNGLLDIANATELANIRYNLVGTSYKTSSTDMGNSTGCPAQGCVGYELIDNIDLASVTDWTPIQGQADATITTSDACVDDNSGVWDGTGCLLPAAFFSAIFDGGNTNGNTISNLTISSSSNILGLFGVVSGTLKNVKLRDGSITGLSTNATTAGALAGNLVSGGIIEASSANLVVTAGAGNDHLGGLVGSNSGTIQDSNATGAVTSGAGKDYLGSLVGFNGGSGIIQDSNATGAVTSGASNDHVGGLVGSNSGIIQDSYATTGAITGGVGSDRVGGLVGYNGVSGTIQDSYATGPAVGAGLYDYVGGLVGESFGIIQNSYAIGVVTGSYSGSNRLGGLVGANEGGTIKDSYATGAVTGGVGTKDSVGGLVGWTYILSSDTISTILNSYALGAVAGGEGANDYVGRIVGRVYGSANIFGNYYIGANTLDGENKRTILTDEAVEKDVDELKALTAATTQTDFTSTDATDGWSTDSWDFTADKYPSLKSYKVDANTDLQVDGELLCGQGADWVQCSP